MKKREEEPVPVAVNWAKVASIALIIALLIATILLAICAFATTASVVGIPVAVICAIGGLATATTMLALFVKTQSEPDIMA